MSSKLVPVAGFVLAAFAAPAFAQVSSDDITVSPQPATRQLAVPAGDLNVDNARGRLTLERRLASAADEVCSAELHYNTSARADIKRCRAAALAGAWRQIDERREGGVTAVGGN